jgi:hypothetical protein
MEVLHLYVQIIEPTIYRTQSEHAYHYQCNGKISVSMSISMVLPAYSCSHFYSYIKLHQYIQIILEVLSYK